MKPLSKALYFVFAFCCLFPALAFSAKPQPTAPADSPTASAAPQSSDATQPVKGDKGKPKSSPSTKPSTSPAVSAEPSSSASPSVEPSPIGEPETMQAQAGGSLAEALSNPAKADPNKFLSGFDGNFDTDLFTGSATYAFPIALPTGRGKATPALSLNYSSSGLNHNSPVGYGWSLPTNAIFRSTTHGVNELYSRDDYAADIFGNYAELIVTDATNKTYGAKSESAFVDYDFDPAANAWLARDKQGTKYFFGQSAASRQTDPNNAAQVYKWLLDKVEDTNGNTITFTYFTDSGQAYPDTIRYSGSGSDLGNYEVRFLREDRPNPPVSFLTGFGVTTTKRISAIEVYSRHSGSPVLVRKYDLDYTDTNSIIDLLASITVSGGTASMPPVRFDYVTNTETLPVGTPIQKKHLLKKITLPSGSTTALLYKPSTAYRTAAQTLANSKLPFQIASLYQQTTTDRVTNLAATTTYEYEGGHYFFDAGDAFTREYAGFAKVKATDPAGDISITRFHQSQFAADNSASTALGENDDHISKRGHIWRQERYDGSGVLYAVTISAWNKTALTDADPAAERFFVSLGKTVSIAFDAKTTGTAAAQEYAYDTTTGNLTTQTDLGDVNLTVSGLDGSGKYAGNGAYTDTGSDKLTTTIEYAVNTSAHILALPKRTYTKNQSNATIAETKLSYDGLAYGSAPTKGNPTKTEALKTAGEYVTEQTAYNSFGLPISFTNTRNYVTTVAYDSLNLYPATVTNAKTHTTAFTYNYLFGVPTQITDPNNLKTKYSYDGLGRPTKTEVSDPADPAQFLTQATYSYDLVSTPASVTATAFANNTDTGGSPIEVTSKTYLDGLGRPLQTRSEGEGSNKYLVTGSVYDSRGNVQKQLLPQFGSGLGYDSNFDEDQPGALNTFDALNRAVTVTVPHGTGSATTTTAYDRRTTTVTDARGYKKDFITDAYGNLIQVKEYLTPGAGASPSGTTTYTYDGNNNLTKITDAVGNVKNFTYNLIGQKLSEEDFHAPADVTFSYWTYTYDNNGNVTAVNDAKNQTTNLTYDELDRPLTEDFTGQTGTEVTYVYDTAPNGKGKVTSIATRQNNQPVITKAYEYDLLGRATKETRTIDVDSYVTNTEYDLAGNLKRIVYPDAAHTEVLYTYNNAGQLENVQQKEDSTTTDLVTDFDYAETGAPATIAYANGVTTTQTYDIAYNYFLTDKETVKGTTKLQDISYAFDSTGNITTITDTSQTDVAKTAAYTYDGLSRLTGATITNTANNEDYSQTFTYDILGNITNKSDVGAYTYAQTNYANPHAVTGADGITYAYDENGNLSVDGTWTHTWDYKDRLLSSTKTGATVSYAYDEGGTRVTKTNTTSSKKTTYVNNLLDIEDTTEKLSFYAGDLKLATQENTATPTLAFHHPDHLTSAGVDTDASGNLLQLTDYYPFGDSRIEDTTTDFHNDYTYTGKERDEDTELLYYEARYYDSILGRFISLDPWKGDITDPQSLNKYAYTLNNPLKYKDPDGARVELVMRELNNSMTNKLGSHSYLRITPDSPLDFGAHTSFTFTLGGQDHGNLIGEMNNEADLNMTEIRAEDIVQTPAGMTDAEFITAILDSHEAYNQNPQDYALFSVGGYNCHDYASTMIDWAGGENPGTDAGTWDPGAGGVIPKSNGPIQTGLWRSELNNSAVAPANQQYFDEMETDIHEMFDRARKAVKKGDDS